MSEPPTIRQLQLKILISDRTRHGSPLWSEHGLSILALCRYDDGDAITILFDAGASPALLRHNLNEVELRLADIDTVLLSHCHRDHTGGLPALLSDAARDVRIVAHPQITRRALRLREGVREVGPDPDMWAEIPARRLLLLRDPAEIHPGVWISGSIPRESEFEEPRPHMYTLQDGRLTPDGDPDDTAVWFRLADHRLVLLTGCGHAGIINTVRHAAQRTGSDHFSAVMGGFHLIDAKETRIRRTVQHLSEFSIDELVTGHCTGETAESAFAAHFGSRHRTFYTGDTYCYDAQD